MKKTLNSLLLINQELNVCVSNNFNKLRLISLFLPLLLLLSITLYLFKEDAFSVEAYVYIQKELFLFINYKLGQFPNTIYNITQLGDASIILSFLGVFILYAPKIVESLLSASLVSLIFSCILKNIFLVPRPAMMFDNNSFVIIGKTAVGCASLPSGHSITVFATLTILLFAFMPIKLLSKIIWFFFIILIGLSIVFTRVGVGAHYPLDVVVGGILGYLAALIGIFFTKNFSPWTWITHKKYYPIIIVLLSVLAITLIYKIVTKNLIIFYVSLISLVVTLIIITSIYVKK
ncbi:phosphatase PAP2 family protein [Flavobacterium sp. J27]|uniref:phosphatase PAP2 family protein n=1 Tax=Flavobacterium sp. J27 TaxID=2060419 RepID=UPI00103074AD|nr:phosphatase PAP2 family protein [Flavobacterium sp. J27]